MKTTLNAIRKHSPCSNGWEKLLTYLGKTKADDEPISIATIIDSNGLSDAIWCLRAVDGKEKEIRLFAVWCARQVQHLMKDQRSLDALDIAEKFANGEATKEELKDASSAANAALDSAAWDADRAAPWAAMVAAGAAMVAAGASAGDAALDSAAGAADAADAAAWAATRGVSVADAWDRMRARQEAEIRRICEEG